MKNITVYNFVDLCVYLPELSAFIVGGRYIPIEITLVKYILNFGVGNEDDFLAVKATQKFRRQNFVEGSCFADGQNEWASMAMMSVEFFFASAQSR